MINCRFDDHNVGFISYDTFLMKIGASEFTPGDLFGTSTMIIDQSKQNLEELNDTQLAKHKRITQNQATRTGFMTVEQVEQALKSVHFIINFFYKSVCSCDSKIFNSTEILEIRGIKPLTNNNFLDWSQLKAFTNDKINVT